MNGPIQKMKVHHRQLEEQLEAFVHQLKQGEPALDELSRYLDEELLLHAVAEEKHLYKKVDEIIGREDPRLTASMRLDHDYIEGLIQKCQTHIDQHASVSSEEQEDHVLALERLAHQLLAVFEIHRKKEEEVFLPLLQTHLDEQEQQEILGQMHETIASEKNRAHEEVDEQELDVRELPPKKRHPLIMDTFDGLDSGESFILVNDHDPKPLYYQFEAEREGEFTWEYLEEGPSAWRVRIART